MAVTVQITGLEGIARRLQNSPGVFERGLKKTLQAALLIIWESIPGYPPPPADSTYRRTGTLGRTIGTSESGGRSAQPQIYEVRKDGIYQAGRIGTRLGYAPYVISKDRQAGSNSHWWTLDGTVLDASMPKLQAAFSTLAKVLAEYIARGRAV